MTKKRETIDLEFKEQIGKIKYNISTLNGQSGAPIICTDEQKNHYIVGIHKGGILYKHNVGRLITPNLIEELKKQAIKLNAQPFNQQE